MSDTLPTTWPITPHTKAKHAILKRYLDAWMPILSNQAALVRRQTGTNKTQRVLYVDGFAGPGVYEHGEPGSPVIAMRTAIQHPRQFPFPIEMVFIEHREDRYRRLCEVVQSERATSNESANIPTIQPYHGDCNDLMTTMLDEHDRAGVHFGPALAFLDQFGYGAVSMALIGRILRIPQCEVFTYLDYKDMNRWITDPAKAPVFDRAFGGAEWRECIALPESKRRVGLLDRYKAALSDRDRGNAKYVSAFSMFDQHGAPLYWLIFCTNNLRGLEEMKRAMWNVDKTGNFRFSDQDEPSQLPLLEVGFSQDWLAEELSEKLAGKTLTVAQIKEHVLVKTPCYLFKNALKRLECGQKLVSVVGCPTNRKPGTFPDAMLKQIRVRFPASLLVG